MKSLEYLKYYEENIEFNINNGEWVTFLGSGNKLLLDSFCLKRREGLIFLNCIKLSEMTLIKIRKNISYVRNDDMDIFVAETVQDEIAFGLESLAISKNEMREIIERKSREYRLDGILDKSPNSLGSSDKAKLKILSSIVCNPKVLILDNILSELDNDDKLRIVELLKDYKESGNIILNFTSDVDDTLFGDRIIITNESSLIADGKTLEILKEEKLMKKLGLGLPFIIELNKYLLDYKIINKYILDMDNLVGAIWK